MLSPIEDEDEVGSQVALREASEEFGVHTPGQRQSTGRQPPTTIAANRCTPAGILAQNLVMSSGSSDSENLVMPDNLEWLNGAIGQNLYYAGNVHGGYVHILSLPKPNIDERGAWIVKAHQVLRDGTICAHKVIEVDAEKITNLSYQEESTPRRKVPTKRFTFEQSMIKKCKAANRKESPFKKANALESFISQDDGSIYSSSNESEESYVAPSKSIDSANSGSEESDHSFTSQRPLKSAITIAMEHGYLHTPDGSSNNNTDDSSTATSKSFDTQHSFPYKC